MKPGSAVAIVAVLLAAAQARSSPADSVDLKLTTGPAAKRLGHGRKPWFAYTRSLGRAAPSACSFVFAFDEVSGAKDNLEILAALLSELPDPLVIDAPPTAPAWPRPLPLSSAAELAAHGRGCEWLSPAARSRMPSQ